MRVVADTDSIRVLAAAQAIAVVALTVAADSGEWFGLTDLVLAGCRGGAFEGMSAADLRDGLRFLVRVGTLRFEG